MTQSYEVIFPDYLHGYELETEAKGYLSGLTIVAAQGRYEVTAYDPVRLAQDVADEVSAHGYFATCNLLVVARVTRDEVLRAAELAARSNFAELVLTELRQSG